MLDLYLTAALSAVLQILGGKTLDAGLERRARKARERGDELDAEKALSTVRGAVEAAKKEFFDELFEDRADGEDDELDLAVRDDLLALLRHPTFGEEVTRRLLFRGLPDFDRLRRFYIEVHSQNEEAVVSERWEKLCLPLDDLFLRIQDHLLADRDLGDLLRQTEQLVRLAKLEDGQQILARLTADIGHTLARLDDRDARRDELWPRLLAASTRQEARLSELAELLGRAVEEQRRRHPQSVTAGVDSNEERYLRSLAEECDRLPLAGDPRGQADRGAVRASLAKVYVDLATTRAPSIERVLERLAVPPDERAVPREILGQIPGRLKQSSLDVELQRTQHLLPRGGELPDDHPLKPWVKDAEALYHAFTTPLSALEALAEHRALVLLGDPGSGKSTFVNHLARTFVEVLLGELSEPREIFPELGARPFFPVRLVLRRWSVELAEVDGVELLYRALCQLSPDVPRQRWLERLDDPQTLVLFDGLDEVPAATSDEERDRRRELVDAVLAFRTAHPRCSVLVTCRVKPYEQGTHQLPGWPTVELARLDRPRIERFCARWYDELLRIGQQREAEAEECRERLVAALARPELAELAKTPLLLTMLASVNARARLPEGRAELYHTCVEQLLWEWEKSKPGGLKLDQLLQKERLRLQRSHFERVLWQLTYEAHGETGKTTADLPRRRLREELARLHPHRHDGWAWANEVIELMADRSGLLIAPSDESFTFPHRSFQEYLAARGLLHEPRLPQIVREKAAADVWHEVVLLACGYLVKEGRFEVVQQIVQELIAGPPPERLDDWRRVLLAGLIWQEFGAHGRVGKSGEELHLRLLPLLTSLMQHRDLPPAQRLAAGLALADLGVLPDDLDALVEIVDEELGTFKIARYPVTNAQFARFIDDGGYDRERGWISKKVQAEILDLVWPESPRLRWDRDLNRLTQPVVGVSWYEAAGYCSWLTELWRAEKIISQDDVVRLPTLAERERVASGPEKRQYPWGEDFDRRFLNSVESGLGQTTPVHMYPDGSSPEGIRDLSGNAWEWTADCCESRSDQAFWLAGGSFWNGKEGTLASSRDWFLADLWEVYVSFRVSVVPSHRARP